MAFDKLTVRDVAAQLTDQVVLVRADYNVSLQNGQVMDDLRLRASLPTLEFLRQAGVAKIIVMSHLGRPKGQRQADLSLAPVAAELKKLLPATYAVNFVDEVYGEKVSAAVRDLPTGGILLLENLRFWPEEEAPISVSAYSFGGKATGQHAVQADQHTGDGYQSSDFLYAPAVEVAHGKEAELTFYHQTAKVVVNIKKEGIMAENPTHKVAIQGALSGTFTAPTGEDTFGTWTADASEGSITPQAIAPTEYAASYQALLIPQTISEGQTLFSFMVDGQTYTYTVPTGGITWETGKEYTYNMTLTMNGTVTVDNAIGLPGGWTDEEEL